MTASLERTFVLFFGISLHIQQYWDNNLCTRFTYLRLAYQTHDKKSNFLQQLTSQFGAHFRNSLFPIEFDLVNTFPSLGAQLKSFAGFSAFLHSFSLLHFHFLSNNFNNKPQFSNLESFLQSSSLISIATSANFSASNHHRIPSNPSPKLSIYFTQWLFPHTAVILSMFLSQNPHSSSGFARCAILDLIGSSTSVNIANSRLVVIAQ